MLITTISITCLLAVPQDVEANKVGPTAAEMAAAIKVAVKAGPAPAIETIEGLGLTPDKVVTRAVAAALKHKDQQVKIAALKALRYNVDESAFAELFKARSSKAVTAQEEVLAEYYLALGQHRNAKALGILTRGLTARKNGSKLTTARLLAIGRVREKTAIDALIKFMQSGRQWAGQRTARVSLVALTGRDEGAKARDWVRWWKENRRSFKFGDKEPELSKRAARTWTKTWQIPGTGSKQEAPKKRGKNAKKKAGRRLLPH